jgi:hypothetical protein
MDGSFIIFLIYHVTMGFVDQSLFLPPFFALFNSTILITELKSDSQPRSPGRFKVLIL